MKILLCGVGGRMGRCVADYCATRQDCRIIAGVDQQPNGSSFSFPVMTDFQGLVGTADVLIDFSAPELAQRAVLYGAQTGTPCVICTTGLSKSIWHTIRFSAGCIPIFVSANMSLGASLLQELCRQAAEILDSEWDIDILEQQHVRKADAPSGTALALGNAVAKNRRLCSEQDSTVPRAHDEVVFHSIRAGGIAGEHLVQFASMGEALQISHTVFDRKIFAAGAVAAARFLIGKPPGLYKMKDLIQK